MNRFRKLGFIDYNGYNGRIQVHKSLLSVVLLDQLPEHNAENPALNPLRLVNVWPHNVAVGGTIDSTTSPT
jgi:hypothetical protein